MTIRSLGAVLLLLVPTGLAYLAGYSEVAHYVGLGALLALQLCLWARPVAPFSILLPMVYAAAAIAAQSTDGVVALIVAIAAVVGAAGSQGLHRGLVALLAAALLGSFEPAHASDVVRRAALLLAGASYGFLLATTVFRHVDLAAPRVSPQSALGYAVLLASVTLVAWFAARMAGFAHGWWLPLAMVAVSDPCRDGSARQSLLRLVLAAVATATLVFAVDAFDLPMVRAALLVVMLFVALATARRHYGLYAVLLIPVLVLMSDHGAVHGSPLDYLAAVLPAFVPVLLIAGLGHWMYWTLRADSGHVPV